MKKILNIAIALAVLSICACKKDDSNEQTKINNPAQPAYKKIGETWISGAQIKATIYSEEELFAGYNKLYVKLTDSLSGSEITTGNLSINPIMEMGSMSHSTPIENPSSASAQNGYFNSNIAFIMSGTWSLNVQFTGSGISGAGTLSVNVVASNPPKIKNVTGTDSSSLFVSFIQPKTPQVGINDFEIAVHSMQSSNDFPAITDYTIEIEPEMPSMGHGSPNNVNPSHTGNGHYKGKVNFTMTGLWRINVTLKKGGNVINDQLYFDITL